MRKTIATVSIRLIAFCAILAGLAAPRFAPACGVWPFEHNYLGAGREDMILSLPKWNFETMLRQMAGVPERAPGEWVGIGAQEVKPETQLGHEVADLDQALREAATPDERRAQILESYRVYRTGMLGQTPPIPGTATKVTPVAFVPLTDELRASLPAEFPLYLQGAEAFRKSGPLPSPDPANPALAAWQRLLDLPPAQRRHRSVWAAFMLGKALLPAKMSDRLTTESAAAIASAFEKTRALAAEGFPDPLGLAAESLGWQARAELMDRATTEAIHHYYDMFRLGTADQQDVAVRSIWHTLRNAIPRQKDANASPQEIEVLAHFASDPLTRDIATIWMASENRGWREWPQAVRDTGKAVSPLVAGHLAAIAYEKGDLASARAFAESAGTSSTLGQWVLAKVLLYEGEVAQGRGLLKEIGPRAQVEYGTGEFGNFEHFDWYAGNPQAEYAVLLLAKKDYAGALEGFLRGEDWADAAYVADRVLSIGELRDFLRRNEKADFLTTPLADWMAAPRPEDRSGGWLRWLLDRRLMRAGKTREALPYLPEKWRGHAERYVRLRAAARDEDRPRRARALDYFAAAWIARYAGMEIMGTESEPDWFDGNGRGSPFDRQGATVLRGLGAHITPGNSYERPLPESLRHYAPTLGKALRPSQDERDRVVESAPSPNVRFHYRFVAADLGWKAARLLPDNDPALPYVLWRSGTWIGPYDDQTADKFYQALVNRCRKFPVSAEADRIRWFPRDEKAPTIPDEIARMVDQKLAADSSRW